MENHLDMHNYEHQQRVKDAERERLAQQLRKENAEPNRALVKLGELMVAAGEQLQRQAQPQQMKQRRA